MITKARNVSQGFFSAAATKVEVGREKLADLLFELLNNISLNDFARLMTNEVSEAIQYADLCIGGKTCQRLSLLFNPHRLSTRTKNSRASCYEALKDRSFVSGLARAILVRKKEGVKFVDQLYYALVLSINAVQYICEFPPHIARDLCRDHAVNLNSKVLDPCAGWGGRMIGSSSICNSYTAYEPSKQTYRGLLELGAFLKVFRNDFQYNVLCEPYENSVAKKEFYDFAITSPPYYDTELYSAENTNSLNRYKTFDKWVVGFYKPLIIKTMAQLKKKSSFILNIGSRKYPLSQIMKEIVGKKKHKVEKLGNFLSGTGSGLGKSGEGESFYRITKGGN